MVLDPNLSASAETALYCAADHRDMAKVELLLKHGAQHDIFTAAIIGDAETVAIMLYAYPPLREARSLKTKPHRSRRSCSSRTSIGYWIFLRRFYPVMVAGVAGLQTYKQKCV